MITVVDRGSYCLLENKKQGKVLIFDDKKSYSLTEYGKLKKIPLYPHKNTKNNCLLCKGNFRLYKVSNEEHLSSNFHLELNIGQGQWQGYLLPKGLPKNRTINSIIPTQELISTLM